MAGKTHVTLFPSDPSLKYAEPGSATQGKRIPPPASSIVEKAQVSSEFAPSTLKESDRALILRTLEATGWVIGGPSGAATRLGLKRTTLIAKMKKLGISRPAPTARNVTHDIHGQLEGDRMWQAVE
jgi:transcriptional regulator with GAF, ATPase, and Fis domain